MAELVKSNDKDLLTWDYTETTTPTSPGDTITGGGALNLTLRYGDEGEFLQGANVTFELPNEIGTLDGWVRSSSFEGSEGMETVAQLTIPTLMAELSVTRVMPLVMDMSISDIIQEYVNQVFTNPPEVIYEGSDGGEYTFVSWEGIVWDGLCFIAAMHNLEITTDGQNIIVRDVGSRIIDVPNKTVPTLSFDENNVGRYLEITYTNQETIESVGGTLENLTTNPSLEANLMGWSQTNDTTSGITNSAGRTTDWAYSGSWSFRHRQSVTDYKNGRARINTPWVNIVGGQPLYMTVAAYLDSNRMPANQTNNYKAFVEIRNGSTVIQTSNTITVTRGSRANFNMATTPSNATSARIVVYRDWSWSG